MATLASTEKIENPDGTHSIITYMIENGEKFKVTQKVRELYITEYIDGSVLVRRKWSKYGTEVNSPPGPNHSTTQLGEKVNLLLGLNWKELDELETQRAKMNPIRLVTCRICGLQHLTIRCPSRSSDKSSTTSNDSEKNVQSSRREGTTDTNSQTARSDRESEKGCSLKITQLNENADEAILKEKLLDSFGYLSRVIVVRNRDTGRSRGFAYVTFSSEEIAEQALQYLNGKGFMNLILHVERTQ